MASAACFISGGLAPGVALEAFLAKESLSLAALDMVCCEQPHGQQEQSGAVKYNVVLAASASPHSRDALARIARSTAPGGRLYVYEALQPTYPSADLHNSRVDALKKDLLLSGFTDAQEVDGSGTTATPAVWASARMPQWGIGAAAKLSLKRPAVAANAASAPPAAGSAAAGSSGLGSASASASAPGSGSGSAAAAAAGGAGGGDAVNVWKLAADGDDDGDEELLDDDQLLTAEDKQAMAPKPDDCEVGQSGRKACKNCSCGRAEAEAAEASGGVKLTADLMDNPQSACGNCYLGDAFRCATCPYRGLPAFKAGEKITLGANMLAADV